MDSVAEEGNGTIYNGGNMASPFKTGLRDSISRRNRRATENHQFLKQNSKAFLAMMRAMHPDTQQT